MRLPLPRAGRSREEQAPGKNHPIDYSSYAMSEREKIRYVALAAGALFALGFVFFQNLLVAGVFSLGSLFYPRIKSKDLARKRQQELNVQFKDALVCLSSSLGAGRSLESAFQAGLKDLRLLYPDREAYIIQEFEFICRRIEINEPIERALRNLSDRACLEDITNFVDVISIAKRTGGNLVEVVQNTARMLSDKIEIKEEIEVLLSKQKYEQKILNFMPLVFIGLLNFGGSDYMGALYASAGGYLLMGFALLILGLSYVISSRIMDIRV